MHRPPNVETPLAGGPRGAGEAVGKGIHKRQSAMSGTNRWARYEVLKAELTAAATNSAEYEAACRRAAQLAGV